MAPRATPSMSSGDLSDDYPGSSPDPLNASINESAMRLKSTRLSRAPLTSSSPSKVNRGSHYSGQVELSPSKSMTMNTGHGGGASPWRIKVTVQAEPGSGSENENLGSPTVKRVTRTTTTTVPLKDDTASSPVKRRGRPRKSDPSSNAKPKRIGTPVRKNTQSGRRSSIAPSDTSMVNEPTEAPPKKRRGRPRKSVQSKPEDDETLVIEETTQIDRVSESPDPELEENSGPRMSLNDQRRQALDATHSMHQEATLRALSEPSTETSVDSRADVISTPQPEEHPARRCLRLAKDEMILENQALATPQGEDLSRKLRQRKGTPHAKLVTPPLDSSDDELATPPDTDDDFDNELAPTHQATSSEEPELNAISEHVQESDEENELQDLTTYAFDEGATRTLDDTTILESENFSMVSVDSLPSSGGLSSSANEQASPVLGFQHIHPTFAKLSPRAPPADAQKNCHRSLQPVSQADSIETTSEVLPAETNCTTQLRREITPLMNTRSPSNPPAIVPATYSPTQAETPRMGRVFKAGVALQGVLDPERLTPTDRIPKIPTNEQGDPLDDLFRGFSEGTRKQLQAGLRLGEQLAMENDSIHKNRGLSPALSRPIKSHKPTSQNNVICSSKQKQLESRLLTPEDQGDFKLPVPPSKNNEIHYPPLPIESPCNQLISPTRSVDEMSWRIDTPPVQMGSNSSPGMVTAFNERGEGIRGAEIYVISKKAENKEYADVWQEEASSALHLPKDVHRPDVFALEGQAKPARGKLPKTWRRRSSSDFNYSDELDEPAHESSPDALNTSEDKPMKGCIVEEEKDTSLPISPGSPRSRLSKVSQARRRFLEPPIVDHDDIEAETDASEASDDTDTGMFFQSNLPSVFNKKRSGEMRRRRAEKQDVSLFLAEGDSLLPDSSPARATKKTEESKLNSFIQPPPRFPALQGSPAKSSPLRNEIRASDPGNSSMQMASEIESTLPQSSPFRTIVDDSIMSVESDARQLHAELENARTDSSLRNLREEADAHAYAYESQYRTLEEIEEVTEASRTRTAIMPSSPPEVIGDKSALRKARAYSPLFSDTHATASEIKSTPFERQPARQAAPRPSVTITPIEDTPETLPHKGGFFGLFSSLWGGCGAASAPKFHPVAMKFDALPKVEPWTKTHYKTLDALYQLHKKQTSLFDPSPPSVNAVANQALLNNFLSESKMSFVGARYSCWGYSVTMTESLVTLCAVYTQLLTLEDIAEYEKKCAKAIQMGDCGPREEGLVINGEDVVQRLATVVMGEELRRDEKRGNKPIVKNGFIQVEWPE